MKRIIGAAVAAMALACGGSASAATLIDFEDGVAGSQYNTTFPGQGYFSTGTVVEEAGNKSILLAGTPLEAVFRAYGAGYQNDPDGRVYLHTFNLISFDVFIPEGGDYSYMGRSRDLVQAGQWLTITRQPYANDDDCRYYCSFFIHGANVRIDNVIFESGLAAIPEPATWAMMIVGFGMVGSGLRRYGRPQLAQRQA